MIGLGGGLGLPELSWLHYSGCCVMSLGLAMLAILYFVFKNTKFLRVPEGETVDAFYRAWKRKRLNERLSKPALAFGAAGVAVVGAGLIVIAVAFLRQ